MIVLGFLLYKTCFMIVSWQSKGTTLPHPKNVVNNPFIRLHFLGRYFRFLWAFEVWTCVSGNCLIPANTSCSLLDQLFRNCQSKSSQRISGGPVCYVSTADCSVCWESSFFFDYPSICLQPSYKSPTMWKHPLNILWKDLLNGSCCSQVVLLEDEISFRDSLFPAAMLVSGGVTWSQ